MIINHNISAMNTYRQMNVNQSAASGSMEKLSSGLRINKAGDDAAGLAISEKMRGQIRGLDQASRNAQDGVSLIQTAEGALGETQSMLQRMRELAVQASNDTLTGKDRTAIQEEVNQLTSEMNRIGNTTEFNSRKLVNGDSGGPGTTGTAGVFEISFTAATVDTDTLNIDGVKFTAIAATGTPDSKDGEFKAADMASLKTAIESSALNDKYTVTTGTDKIILTQKVASNEDAAVTIKGTGKASVDETTNGVSATDGALSLQIGANGGQTFEVDLSDMRAEALGVSSDDGGDALKDSDGNNVLNAAWTSTTTVTDGTSGTTTERALDIGTSDKASAAITVIDAALKKVSDERSKQGAIQNRLEHTINNLNTSSENLTAAESRIRDVDMAKEMMNMTKENIKAQAAQAMLAQANQAPQQVLQLLR
ncbi:flagellin [Guptibacillus hwajinpoensis]|uniref:Flagellin n=1 Tax=Guptibacillus hwajinpoensis TaxID=208199 RepID=A0A0J6CWW7_9BACL|nr:flagellin [Alkalihalobacillus macyae]KMM36554.1 flagellin [Alkalihalobacillus macyae]